MHLNILLDELPPEEREAHEYWMREAIAEARKAEALGEVPIGAVIVRHGEIIGRGYNLRETTMDSTAHAEMVAIRKASIAMNYGGCSIAGSTLPLSPVRCVRGLWFNLESLSRYMAQQTLKPAVQAPS